MLLKTKGFPQHLSTTLVGAITRNAADADKNKILILENEEHWKAEHIFKALLLPYKNAVPGRVCVEQIVTTDHLMEGDIVSVTTDGIVHTLYRVNSRQNFLLATERCNSNCLMCSQPPKDKNDIPFLLNIHRQLIPLIPKDCEEIGITGGEPTLMGEDYFALLKLIKEELPDTEVHCLTNGRSFAWKNMATQLESLDYKKLMLGIPLYADYYQQHDYIVQAKDAFDQTMRGLYNLAAFGQRIEIRIVLHLLSIPRLMKLAKYIYKNLPFVEHVAFMGLEFQGYTPHNIKKLWIDPIDYMDELCKAVEFLSGKGMNVSIYNSQLCVMPERLWRFNKRSISDWKNIYLDECGTCGISEQCGGLFASCEGMHSRGIRAVGRLVFRD